NFKREQAAYDEGAINLFAPSLNQRKIKTILPPRHSLFIVSADNVLASTLSLFFERIDREHWGKEPKIKQSLAYLSI
ncbi:hypothetical protein, partial [Aeromonas media]|uniref:hypothetical protein n=1 Tax=Aeromonas media TaxID=651 RepID=UPI001F31D7DE